MSFFRRHTEPEKHEIETPEEFDFPFHVLWEDQVDSPFPILPIVQIGLLVIILIVIIVK